MLFTTVSFIFAGVGVGGVAILQEKERYIYYLVSMKWVWHLE